MDTVFAGKCAAVLALVGYIFYIRSIVVNRHKDKSLTAWIIWTVVGFLLLKSYQTVGHGQTEHSKWLLLVYTVSPPTILLLLVFVCKSYKAPFSRLDKIFLTSSLLSGVYLWFFNEGILPLHVNMAIDVSGSYLVARNAWHDPETEDTLSWIIFTCSACINLLAVQEWAYTKAVYPVVLVGMCISVLAVSAFRPKKISWGQVKTNHSV